MKILKDILYKVPIEAVIGSTAISVSNIAFDSRKIDENGVFIAVKGTVVNGHDFINQAIKLGAIAVVCEVLPEVLHSKTTYIQVKDANQALANLSSNWFQNPSKNLKLIGVTGTNGKTSVTTLLYQLFKKAGYKVGLLSTVQVRVHDTLFKATHTTPDSISINHYLELMNDEGVEFCFMEVSSHGIHQKRTEGLHFYGGVFTNLSHDHLDYHKTFAEYRDVKKSFFDQLPKDAFALVNIDDKNGAYMLQNTKAKKVTYALKTLANYKAQLLENSFEGLLLKIDNNSLWTTLVGSFNAYNILSIYATAELLGLETLENLRIISELESVRGRFQYLKTKQNITAIVDYAHTPNALLNVLETINHIRTKNEALITVFGCGGERDKSKRPKMGHIAATLSTKIIITSDNPRNEDPESIIAEIEKGVAPQHYKKTLSIANRKEAIKTACQLAQPNDIILIAGKGHETYQEIKGQRLDLDDFNLLNEYLNQLQK